MSQIFKLKIPNTELFELLDTICVKTSNHYFFNTISFKKGLLDDKIQYYLENMNEKILLFLGESNHKIKKKAEQSACKIGYDLMHINQKSS